MPKKGDPDPIEQDPYWADLQTRIGTNREMPDRAAIESAEKRLDSMMDRAFSTLDSLDKKAEAVPAAVAAVTAFLAGRINLSGTDWWVVALGVATVAAGGVASALAVWSFAAMRFQSGAGSLDLAKKTTKTIDSLRRDQGVLDAMAVALLSAQVAMEVKATRLNAALSVAVLGILFLAFFAGAGGIK